MTQGDAQTGDEVDVSLTGSAHGQSRVAAELTTSPSAVTYSPTSEGGVWNFKQASHDFKVRIESEKTHHQLQQDAEDQRARRFREKWIFIVIVSVVVTLLVFGLLVGTMAENGTTRSWTQGLVSSLLGALGGAFAGYATGKSQR